jgi:dipeptidyl aminopeptidase/acylaminoacyl peptidase
MTTQMLGFDTAGQTLYMLDSRGRDTGALFAHDTKTGERKLVHADARADVSGILAHPTTGKAQAVAVNYLRNEWVVLDPAIAPDLDALKKLAAGGEFGVSARTEDDKTWVVSVSRSDRSTETFLYDRATRKAKPWFDTRPALPDAQLSKMHGVEIKSRDGLTLPSYLTLPAGSDPDGDGRPNAPVPMVLLVHGGPWARDGYGLNPSHQWFANRGYATLSVNFRGSTGFGKAFVNAGDLQWGRKMHDDLIDAVRWAVQQRIAVPDKVAIMGGSYGGYAALAGLTMTPKEFACGVSIVGPSNLNTLLQTIPPYWGPIRRMFASRMGDDTTEEGRALLKERSPLTYVDAIERPLLIGQGANDPRVKQAESDQIVQAMQAKKIPVTYVLYPDEGHGFVRPPNRISFNAVAETFLGQCLGGRVQPIGNDFAGSSIQVPTGADGVPGVAQALQAIKPAPKN